MSQARLPRTEPSTELITAHKVNNCDAHASSQTRDFSALPKHREPMIGGSCAALTMFSLLTSVNYVLRSALLSSFSVGRGYMAFSSIDTLRSVTGCTVGWR